MVNWRRIWLTDGTNVFGRQLSGRRRIDESMRLRPTVSLANLGNGNFCCVFWSEEKIRGSWTSVKSVNSSGISTAGLIGSNPHGHFIRFDVPLPLDNEWHLDSFDDFCEERKKLQPCAADKRVPTLFTLIDWFPDTIILPEGFELCWITLTSVLAISSIWLFWKLKIW